MSHILYGVIYLNRKLLWLPTGQERTHTLGLLLCAALFICGCIAGTVAAGFVGSARQLGSTVGDYLAMMSDKTAAPPELLASVIDAYKYHLPAVFLGFSVLGVIFIPVLCAVRGFFLSFSVAVLIRLLGSNGILLVLAAFGISTLITIPCFFILSVTSFSASQYLLRLATSKGGKNPGLPPAGRAVAACALCLVLLFVSALIETYLTPQLINYAAAHISL